MLQHQSSLSRYGDDRDIIDRTTRFFFNSCGSSCSLPVCTVDHAWLLVFDSTRYEGSRYYYTHTDASTASVVQLPTCPFVGGSHAFMCTSARRTQMGLSLRDTYRARVCLTISSRRKSLGEIPKFYLSLPVSDTELQNEHG